MIIFHQGRKGIARKKKQLLQRSSTEGEGHHESQGVSWKSPEGDRVPYDTFTEERHNEKFLMVTNRGGGRVRGKRVRISFHHNCSKKVE